MNIFNINTEYKFNPIGIDEARPRFSYEFSDGVRAQQERRIVVTAEYTGDVVWDSGWQRSGLTSQIVYDGKELRPFNRYILDIQAKVQDFDGEEHVASNDQTYWFETGFLGTPWEGRWIGQPNGWHQITPGQVRHFFRSIPLKKGKKLARARLYATSLGIYEARINGKPVSEDCLTPGWTDYYKRVQYQAYDISEMLGRKGENQLEIRLASGWFAGTIADDKYVERISRIPLLKCEIHLVYEDGTKERIVSDEEFATYPMFFISPFRYSDIYLGECYDAYKDEKWRIGNRQDPKQSHRNAKIVEGPADDIEVVWNSGATVRRIDELPPRKITRLANGVYVVDFGQNISGREKLVLKNTRRGNTIIIKHGEMLNSDGTVFTDNLRDAWATTVYSTGHNRVEKFEPTFTFYGFRYLEISGWPGELTKENVSAVVLSSQLEQTGDFYCSEDMLNRLYSCIVWGQCGNFVDIPSDCPQRDERYGWTGDIQVFADVASYNMNCATFFTKWLADLNSCQAENGSYPDIAPNHRAGELEGFSSGWADASIVVAWTMFEKYGDTRILERHFPNMLKYVTAQHGLADDAGLLDCATYGDWLHADDPTSAKFIATAYHVGMLDMMIKIAEILKKTPEMRDLARMRNKSLADFQGAFINAKGQLAETSQTAQLLALHFNLLPPRTARHAVRQLLKSIGERDNHLSTGFLGTPLLLEILSKYGKIDEAYDLLLQTSYPSWLYPITQGATTMWERWNSYTHENGFGDIGMLSFNHYAYGAVGNWFYRNICGIQPDSTSTETAGFKHFVLAPQPGTCLKSAEASFCSHHGPIQSSWIRTDEEEIIWEFYVPGNTTAKIIPPGKIVSGAEDLIVGYDGSLTAGPGEYRLVIRQ